MVHSKDRISTANALQARGGPNRPKQKPIIASQLVGRSVGRPGAGGRNAPAAWLKEGPRELPPLYLLSLSGRGRQFWHSVCRKAYRKSFSVPSEGKQLAIPDRQDWMAGCITKAKHNCVRILRKLQPASHTPYLPTQSLNGRQLEHTWLAH